MKRFIILLLLAISLQGFSQPGFQGYLTNNTYRGMNATQKAGLPADTFNVLGLLKNYKWIALKNNTIYIWEQSQNKWIAYSSGSGSSYTFTMPLLNTSGAVTIKGLSTVGINGQVPISNGTQWNYHYPFNGDSARMYSFETKGRLRILDGGVNLDTLYIDSTVVAKYVATASSIYNVTPSDYTINCTAGNITVNLPAVLGIQGRIIVVKNTGAGTITIDGNGSELIDGSATFTLGSVNKYGMFQATATGWIVIGNN